MKVVHVCALLSLAGPALAQAPPPAPPPAREGTAEFALVSTTGNASTQTIGVGAELILRPDTWVVKNRASFVRNESEDVLTAESFLYLFRADKTLTPRLSALGEYSYFRDEFAGVDHRNNVLGGVSYKVLELPEHLFFVDAGVGYLNEQRLAGDNVSTGTYAGGAGYKWKVSPNTELTEDFRYTGTFADADDWRVNNIVSVTASMTAIFSLKLSNTVRYSHAPVVDFESTDTITSVALVAKF
jgi:putative salt-induced outer membrane protein YdiY